MDLNGYPLDSGKTRLNDVNTYARNLASAAGAAPGSIDGIVDRMVSEGNISLSRARDLANRE